VYEALKGVWDPLGCMGPFRMYGASKGVWDPLGCMGSFRVYEAFKGIWDPLECTSSSSSLPSGVSDAPGLLILHLLCVSVDHKYKAT
jgi:hypothetical protein